MSGPTSTAERALPKGSLVLVTGVSGFIGAHVAREALRAGYHVRGTVRSDTKAQLTQKALDNHPHFSTVLVPDFRHEGAFDEALRGVDAVIHVASDTSLSADPNLVVPPVIAGVNSILQSASRAGTVKRFVYTTSSAALALPQQDKAVKITADDWNEASVKRAWAAGPPWPASNAFDSYAASKVEGERAVWKFVKEQKPNFVVNSVAPNTNFGTVLTVGGPTGGLVEAMLNGTYPSHIPMGFYIDVADDARLHVIALLDPAIENQRLLAYADRYSWNEIIGILKELRPDASLPSLAASEKPDLSEIDSSKEAALLKQWYGQDGFVSLRRTIEESLVKV